MSKNLLKNRKMAQFLKNSRRLDYFTLLNINGKSEDMAYSIMGDRECNTPVRRPTSPPPNGRCVGEGEGKKFCRGVKY